MVPHAPLEVSVTEKEIDLVAYVNIFCVWPAMLLRLILIILLVHVYIYRYQI